MFRYFKPSIDVIVAHYVFSSFKYSQIGEKNIGHRNDFVISTYMYMYIYVTSCVINCTLFTGDASIYRCLNNDY